MRVRAFSITEEREIKDEWGKEGRERDRGVGWIRHVEEDVGRVGRKKRCGR